MSYDDRRIAEVFSVYEVEGLWKEHTQEVRKAGYQLASEILHRAPSTPERTIAINKVREAVMYAKDAIALAKH